MGLIDISTEITASKHICPTTAYTELNTNLINLLQIYHDDRKINIPNAQTQTVSKAVWPHVQVEISNIYMHLPHTNASVLYNI